MRARERLTYAHGVHFPNSAGQMMPIHLPYAREFEKAQAGHAAIPFGDSTSVAAGTTFTGFGFTGSPAAGSADFFPGWKLVLPAGSGLEQLRAMFTGSLWIEKVEGAVPYYRLLLAVNDPTLLLALQHLHPSWLPAPAIVVYENVEIESVRTTLKALSESTNLDDQLATDDCIAYLAAAYDQHFADWADAVDAFLDDIDTTFQSAFPLFVIAGMSIGAAATCPDDPTALEARIYLRRLFETADVFSPDPDNLFFNLSYYMQLWPELFALASAHPLFSDISTAHWGPVTNLVFRFVRSTGGYSGETFTDVLRPASTITEAIRVAAPHDTVVILDTGTYAETELLIDKPLTLTSLSTADPLSATRSSFPLLSGSAAHRVLQVRLASTAPAGLVCVRQLAIVDGRHTEVETSDDGALGGGGVMVYEHHESIIERCCFENNTTVFGAWTTRNVIDAIETGVTNPAFRLLILGMLMLDDETTALLRDMPNGGWNTHGYGGGCSLIGSSAYVRGSRFSSNTTCARGGGLSFAGYGWPVVEGCRFENNSSSGPDESPPCDGGAIGATACIPLPAVQRYNFRNNDLVDAIIAYVNAGANLDWTSGYSFFRSLFRARKADWYDSASLVMAKNSHAVLRNNIITGNKAADDGGGVYVSILCRCVFIGNTISANQARGAGGGIRATMASDILLMGDTVGPNNVSNSLPNVDTNNGGGGMSVRNSDCTIEGVIVTGNSAQGFGGGGIYYTATDEGTIPGFDVRLYHAILIEIFEFDGCEVSIDSASEITLNTATLLTGQTVDHGKGGGLYMFHYDAEDDVPSLSVSIEACASIISGNVGSFADADELYVDDEVQGTVINDTNVSSYLSAGTFMYSSP
jgi:hypothetical protein